MDTCCAHYSVRLGPRVCGRPLGHPGNHRPVGPRKGFATCHPTRRERSNGLCAKCYYDDYYMRNPLTVLNAKRTYTLKTVEHREARKLAQYGMTLLDYHTQFQAQDGRCAICRRPETASSQSGHSIKWLSVDHDHQSGLNRGLLCGRCNTALGSFSDNPALLLRAAVYLATRLRPSV